MNANRERLTRYFDRIAYGGPAEPTLQALEEICWLHQLAIPFENLDIYLYRRPISLVPDAIYTKLVQRRRGGFCFEQNGLLAIMLETMGYGVSMGYATWELETGEWVAPFDHLVLKVTIPGQATPWLADVGFGRNTPAGPLPLRHDAKHRQPRSGIEYRIGKLTKTERQWRIAMQPAGEPPQPLYEADLRPRRMDEFEHRNQFNQTSPDSHFTQGLICSRPTADGGRVTIAGDLLIQTRDGERTETPLAGSAARARALEKWFGIEMEESS